MVAPSSMMACASGPLQHVASRGGAGRPAARDAAWTARWRVCRLAPAGPDSLPRAAEPQRLAWLKSPGLAVSSSWAARLLCWRAAAAAALSPARHLSLASTRTTFASTTATGSPAAMLDTALLVYAPMPARRRLSGPGPLERSTAHGRARLGSAGAPPRCSAAGHPAGRTRAGRLPAGSALACSSPGQPTPRSPRPARQRPGPAPRPGWHGAAPPPTWVPGRLAWTVGHFAVHLVK